MSIAWVYLWLTTHGRLHGVRWERLFDDVEAQLEAAERDDFVAEVADRGRRELAHIRLVERLRWAVGSSVELTVAGAGIVRGGLERVGPDWLLISAPGRPAAVVAGSAVVSVRGLALGAEAPGSTGEVAARLDLAFALRAVARDRSSVTVVTTDAGRATGTIDRVGADFVDLAEHGADVARRPDAVIGVRTISFSGLAMVSLS
jgi:hypothetical protein